MKHFKIQLFLTTQNVQILEIQNPKYNSLILVCIYAKSTPWGACTRYKMVTIELHEMATGSDLFEKNFSNVSTVNVRSYK